MTKCDFSLAGATTKVTTTVSTPTTKAVPTIEILDPSSPDLETKLDEKDPKSGWRLGAKRILGSFAGVCQRLNQLLLKVVAKLFPWNRRAKRRLRGVGEDDE